MKTTLILALIVLAGALGAQEYTEFHTLTEARNLPAKIRSLRGIDVTDAALKEALSSCNPVMLDLSNCDRLTGKGLAPVFALASLQTLILADCDKLRDDDFAGLARLGLKELSLRTWTYLGAHMHVKSAAVKALASIKSLERLDLSGCSDLENEDLEALAGLTKLKSLKLNEVYGPDDKGLAELAKLPALEELEIEGYWGTVAGLGVFAQTRLKALVLDSFGRQPGESDIDDDGVKVIARLRSLEKLSLLTRRLTDKGLATLATMKKLTWLSINPWRSDKSKLGGAGIEKLAALPALKTLRLAMLTDFNSEVPAALGKILTLECLFVDQWAMDSGARGWAAVMRLPKLRELELRGCQHLTDEDLAQFENVAGLERLCLTGCDAIRGPGLEKLRGATKLKELDIGMLQYFNAASLANISGMTALEKLSLAHLKLTDDALAALETLTNLVELDLSAYYGNEKDSWLTNAGASHLAPLKKLRVLNLRGATKVGDAMLEQLSSLPELAELDLGGCEVITAKGLAALTKLKKMAELNLADIRSGGSSATRPGMTYGDAGLAEVARMASLRRLSVYGNTKVTDEGITQLKALLLLEALVLSGCPKLTDDGLDALQKLLPDCAMYNGGFGDGAARKR